MEGDQFTFMVLLKFERDSFRPVVVGRIEAREGGSIIRAVLRLHWAVAVFMAVWIAVPLLAGIATMARDVRGGRFGFPSVAPVIFAVAGYLLCMTFFWLGARRVKRLLADVARGVSRVSPGAVRIPRSSSTSSRQPEGRDAALATRGGIARRARCGAREQLS